MRRARPRLQGVRDQTQRSEAAQSLGDHVGAKHLPEPPRHEQAAAQEVGAGVAAAQLQHAGGLRMAAERADDRLRADAGDPAEERHARRRRQQADPARDVAEGGVAGEQLVAAEAGNGNLEPQLARGLGHEPRIDAVDGRLVHRLQNARQVGLELRLADDARGVASPVEPGHLLSQRSFILGTPAKLVERQGHGLHILLAGVAHQADQRAGIDPGRVECPTGTSATR